MIEYKSEDIYRHLARFGCTPIEMIDWQLRMQNQILFRRLYGVHSIDTNGQLSSSSPGDNRPEVPEPTATPEGKVSTVANNTVSSNVHAFEEADLVGNATSDPLGLDSGAVQEIMKEPPVQHGSTEARANYSKGTEDPKCTTKQQPGNLPSSHHDACVPSGACPKTFDSPRKDHITAIREDPMQEKAANAPVIDNREFVQDEPFPILPNSVPESPKPSAPPKLWTRGWRYCVKIWRMVCPTKAACRRQMKEVMSSNDPPWDSPPGRYTVILALVFAIAMWIVLSYGEDTGW